MAITSQTDRPGRSRRSASFNHRCYGESHYFIRESALTQLTHSSVVPHPFWALRWRDRGTGYCFPRGPPETAGNLGQGGLPEGEPWPHGADLSIQGRPAEEQASNARRNSGRGLIESFKARQNKIKQRRSLVWRSSENLDTFSDETDFPAISYLNFWTNQQPH